MLQDMSVDLSKQMQDEPVSFEKNEKELKELGELGQAGMRQAANYKRLLE